MPPTKVQNPNDDLIFFSFWVILFQEILEFKHTIAFYYKRQQSLAFQGYVPNPQVWVIIQIIEGILGLVVQQCVLNQNQSY